MIGRYLTPALAVALAVMAGIAMWQIQRVQSLAEENARLERNAEALQWQAEQQEEAKRVARAEADRWEAKAAEYQAALDGLTEGVEDAPLDDRLRDRLNSVLTRP